MNLEMEYTDMYSEVEKKFDLNIPQYPGTDGVVELPPYQGD